MLFILFLMMDKERKYTSADKTLALLRFHCNLGMHHIVKLYT